MCHSEALERQRKGRGNLRGIESSLVSRQFEIATSFPEGLAYDTAQHGIATGLAPLAMTRGGKPSALSHSNLADELFDFGAVAAEIEHRLTRDNPGQIEADQRLVERNHARVFAG